MRAPGETRGAQQCYEWVMGDTRTSPRAIRRASPRRSLVALACASAACAWLVPAPLARAEAPASTSTPASASNGVQSTVGANTSVGSNAAPGSPDTPATKTIASATLTQCATATAPQTERSATFTGEMTAIPGTARMQMRVNLQELEPAALRYRTVSAPGLSVWRDSDPGVKVFTYIRQVTNLSAPAVYRGAVRFRWLSARGRVIKSEELQTAKCEQPAPAPPSSPTPSAGASAPSS